jgi:hypothetical protein
MDVGAFDARELRLWGAKGNARRWSGHPASKYEIKRALSSTKVKPFIEWLLHRGIDTRHNPHKVHRTAAVQL